MKLKLSPQQKPCLTVTSSLSPNEFLNEARTRFPNPSPFMEEFLRRYEDLVKGNKETTHLISNIQKDLEGLHCPCCGTQLMLESEAM